MIQERHPLNLGVARQIPADYRDQDMDIVVHIKGNLVWRWGRTKHGNYVAICDPIAQTVQADRFHELLETISEALDSTFTELLSSGDLEKFLRDRGWSSPDLPVQRRRKNVRFDMPFDLKGVRSRDLEAASC